MSSEIGETAAYVGNQVMQHLRWCLTQRTVTVVEDSRESSSGMQRLRGEKVRDDGMDVEYFGEISSPLREDVGGRLVQHFSLQL